MPAASLRPEKPKFKATCGCLQPQFKRFTQLRFHRYNISRVYSCRVTPETVPVPLRTVLHPTLPSLPPFPDLYFPAGQSAANPKSLPASPWRQASVEQMASVCRAAIKEEETSGEMKVGQDRTGRGGEGRGEAMRGGAIT